MQRHGNQIFAFSRSLPDRPRVIQSAMTGAKSVLSMYFKRCTSPRARVHHNATADRACAKGGGSAIALRTNGTVAELMGKRRFPSRRNQGFFELPQIAPTARANPHHGAPTISPTTETDGWIDHLGDRFRGPSKIPGRLTSGRNSTNSEPCRSAYRHQGAMQWKPSGCSIRKRFSGAADAHAQMQRPTTDFLLKLVSEELALRLSTVETPVRSSPHFALAVRADGLAACIQWKGRGGVSPGTARRLP